MGYDDGLLMGVARNYLDRNGDVLAAVAELLGDIEIAAGIEDIPSINAFLDIAHTILLIDDDARDRLRRKA